jgi:hypothetical protein
VWVARTITLDVLAEPLRVVVNDTRTTPVQHAPGAS